MPKRTKYLILFKIYVVTSHALLYFTPSKNPKTGEVDEKIILQ